MKPADRARLWKGATLVVLVALSLITITSAAPTRAGSDGGNARYYVAVGDSFTAGYRPDGKSGSATRDGYAYRLLDKLSREGTWKLVNFACTGQTAHDMQFNAGCHDGALATGGVDYPGTTQETAVEQFIAAHHRQIGLVTVSMGANDLLKCLDITDDRRAQHCAENAASDVHTSLQAFLTAMRSQLGPATPIVGLSYIDSFRAGVLDGTATSQRRAAISQVLFDNYLNPVLKKTYAQFNVRYVDVFSLAGGDLPDTQKSLLPGHGTVPTTIARICTLTYFCTDNDPHPNREGHELTAQAIAEAIR
ncbi:SGNH/GDSL hydrolase family protein [Mycobacterium sp. PDNC021]|uniref:SGNH/GDSL hydrolase family protein n=1 Tax=Mycobacterium sp. PDNC021 TaxID=3391399 RepID=UPI003AAF7510